MDILTRTDFRGRDGAARTALPGHGFALTAPWRPTATAHGRKRPRQTVGGRSGLPDSTWNGSSHGMGAHLGTGFLDVSKRTKPHSNV